MKSVMEQLYEDEDPENTDICEKCLKMDNDPYLNCPKNQRIREERKRGESVLITLCRDYTE